jgi:hypothetical protein
MRPRAAYLGGRVPSPFTLLNAEHQRSTVLKLADSRAPDHTIAQMTGLSVDRVRRWIAERAIERAREWLQ